MSRRYLAAVAALLAFCAVSRAQVNLEEEFFSLPDTVTNEYLDSLKLQVRKTNDYFMAGVYGGISLERGFFNPLRESVFVMQYPVVGFSMIRQFTMFGLFPNMGFEFGAQFNHEGYEFKVNKETGNRPVESGSGAYKVQYQVPEAFMLSHFHFDIGEYFKLMAKVGLYMGYRTRVHRTLDESEYENYIDQFMDYDLRLSYGLQGGVGFAVVLNPFEFHLNAQVKWGWGSFWKPDYASPYYYRFGYPLDGAVTFGVYYQITPRYGHTRSQLRKLARKMIEEEMQHE